MTSNATSTMVEDARAAQLEQFMKRADDTAGMPKVFTVNSEGEKGIPAVSTGSLELDIALGVGGLPLGRVVELYGPEGSGKTTLALSTAAQAIKAGGMVGFVDAENAISFEHAKNLGVDLDYFVVSQPDSGEDCLQMAEKMIESDLFNVVVVDSVAAMVPRAELEGDIGDQHVGLQARMMSQALRKLSNTANKHGALLIFINQLREKIGQSYGNPEVTPGGKALKFYSSVRIEVRSSAGDRIWEGTGVNKIAIGQTCRVEIKKNKVAPPFRKAEYKLFFDTGIDAAGGLVLGALKTGLWTKRGGNHYDGATQVTIAKSGAEAEQYLRDNPEVAESLREAIMSQLNNDGLSADAPSTDVAA